MIRVLFMAEAGVAAPCATRQAHGGRTVNNARRVRCLHETMTMSTMEPPPTTFIMTCLGNNTRVP